MGSFWKKISLKQRNQLKKVQYCPDSDVRDFAYPQKSDEPSRVGTHKQVLASTKKSVKSVIKHCTSRHGKKAKRSGPTLSESVRKETIDGQAEPPKRFSRKERKAEKKKSKWSDLRTVQYCVKIYDLDDFETLSQSQKKELGNNPDLNPYKVQITEWNAAAEVTSFTTVLLAMEKELSDESVIYQKAKLRNPLAKQQEMYKMWQLDTEEQERKQYMKSVRTMERKWEHVEGVMHQMYAERAEARERMAKSSARGLAGESSRDGIWQNRSNDIMAMELRISEEMAKFLPIERRLIQDKEAYLLELLATSKRQIANLEAAKRSLIRDIGRESWEGLKSYAEQVCEEYDQELVDVREQFELMREAQHDLDQVLKDINKKFEQHVKNLFNEPQDPELCIIWREFLRLVGLIKMRTEDHFWSDEDEEPRPWHERILEILKEKFSPRPHKPDDYKGKDEAREDPPTIVEGSSSPSAIPSSDSNEDVTAVKDEDEVPKREIDVLDDDTKPRFEENACEEKPHDPHCIPEGVSDAERKQPRGQMKILSERTMSQANQEMQSIAASLASIPNIFCSSVLTNENAGSGSKISSEETCQVKHTRQSSSHSHKLRVNSTAVKRGISHENVLASQMRPLTLVRSF